MRYLNFVWIFAVIISSSSCTNSLCEQLVVRVDALEQSAKEDFDYAMRNRTTVTKTSTYTIEFTKGEREIREAYNRELRVAAQTTGLRP